MGKEILVRGIPLIKTQDEEKINFLQNGTLYCNKLSYYRNLENEKNDHIIGDSFEAMLPIKDAVIYFPEEETCIKVEDKLIPTTWSDDYIFCMTGLKPNSISEDYIPVLSNTMDSFGKKSLLILDSKEFISRVVLAGKRMGYSVEYDFVRYYDDKYYDADMLTSLVHKTSNISFWKRKNIHLKVNFVFCFTAIGTKII